MIHAYNKIYLNQVQDSMGTMLHFVVHDMKWDINKYYDCFISSGVAKMLEHAEPQFAAGKSGYEIAYEVYYRIFGSSTDIKPNYVFGRSPEYFAGWSVAYYSWYKAKSFNEINRAVPIDTIVDMYMPYHEMDVMHFVDEIDARMSKYYDESRLKRLRSYARLTQQELADKSGVSKRMIEQYEQGRKELKNASVATVIKLADVLRCDVRELV